MRAQTNRGGTRPSRKGAQGQCMSQRRVGGTHRSHERRTDRPGHRNRTDAGGMWGRKLRPVDLGRARPATADTTTSAPCATRGPSRQGADRSGCRSIAQPARAGPRSRRDSRGLWNGPGRRWRAATDCLPPGGRSRVPGRRRRHHGCPTPSRRADPALREDAADHSPRRGYVAGIHRRDAARRAGHQRRTAPGLATRGRG